MCRNVKIIFNNVYINDRYREQKHLTFKVRDNVKTVKNIDNIVTSLDKTSKDL